MASITHNRFTCWGDIHKLIKLRLIGVLAHTPFLPSYIDNQALGLVVDDPISSFDSNHLFHAYSFMKVNCEKAKQLFVFTHNFTNKRLIPVFINFKRSNLLTSVS